MNWPTTYSFGRSKVKLEAKRDHRLETLMVFDETQRTPFARAACNRLKMLLVFSAHSCTILGPVGEYVPFGLHKNGVRHGCPHNASEGGIPMLEW